MARPEPRTFRGLRDVFSQDLRVKRDMIEAVRGVYESYGFVPLETPAIEYVDVLGKFLPESATPEGGIFAFRNPDLAGDAAPDDPDRWLALRYDLTAPLARVVAEHAELPRPFRRYQIGDVWRYEKPGPGRYRQFTQLDFDSVGVPDVSADAEACCVICDALEAVGFDPSDFVVRVNDRKIMQGVLEVCGLADTGFGDVESQSSAVLRAIDKLDRLGRDAVVELLGAGRKDESGDVTPGARLGRDQIGKVEEYLDALSDSRSRTCERLAALVQDSAVGRQGVEELVAMDGYLTRLGYGADRVVFDPTVIRGLAYYTGPVFEGVITREVLDEKGRPRDFGSVCGGGRYDSLVERFTGETVQATGASAGVDRLLEAVKLLRAEPPRAATADVLITAMDRSRTADYLAMARTLRAAGIATEVFLGTGGIKRQLKYADRMGYRLVVIAGGDEFARGEVQVKDLALGAELAAGVESRDEWRKGQPAQRAVPAETLVDAVRETLRASDPAHRGGR